jgi:SAM-dependent methyltransferase
MVTGPGSDEMRLFKFGDGDETDLDLYRRTQIAANKRKINNQWVPEEHIAILSRYMLEQGVQVRHGICHGTRRGNEQMWFRTYLGPDADVFGTEISDTATDFPFTIQWGFHDVKPEWLGRMDFVYSNSWDHAHDPERAFAGWASCLRPGGLLLLDHGWNYLPQRVGATDPFGITEAGLIAMLNRVCAPMGKVVDTVDGGKHKRFAIRTIVVRIDEAADG